MDIRSKLSARLQSEISRKCSNPTRIAHQTKLPKEVIEGYIKAERVIQFDELRPICESLNIGLMWLLSPNYKPSHLTFRAVADHDLTKVSRIENAFLTIGSVLPQVKNFSSPKLNLSERDPAMLQAEINAAVVNLRQKYSTVEDLYSIAELPILPVSSGENGFDAFIMNTGKSSIVCVNRDKPPARIHFSLLHEMAHFLWHREKDVPVDVSIEGYFNNDSITENNIPEYIANKFAQQFIFPINYIETITPNKWKSLPNVAQLIAERRTTPDVFAFAIFDYLKLTSKPIQFTNIRDSLKEQAGSGWGNDRSVLDFVEHIGEELKSKLYQNRDLFSDNVWAEIKIAWELSID